MGPHGKGRKVWVLRLPSDKGGHRPYDRKVVPEDIDVETCLVPYSVGDRDGTPRVNPWRSGGQSLVVGGGRDRSGGLFVRTRVPPPDP